MSRTARFTKKGSSSFRKACADTASLTRESEYVSWKQNVDGKPLILSLRPEAKSYFTSF